MTQQTNRGKLLATIAGLVAIAAVSTSIWLHPPSENRARRLDWIRIERMNNIDRAINTYFREHHVLPPDLKTLDKDDHQPHVSWEDPETRQPFEYHISGEKSYRLCANFARNYDADPEYLGHTYKAGHDCIDYTIDEPAHMSTTAPDVNSELKFDRSIGSAHRASTADDRRLRSMVLTTTGRQLVARAQQSIWPRIEAAVADACAGASGPLLAQLSSLEEALAAESLHSRATCMPAQN